MPGAQEQQVQQAIEHLPQEGRVVEDVAELSLDRVVLHGSGFQQAVDLLLAVQGIIEVEEQLRHYAHLLAYAAA